MCFYISIPHQTYESPYIGLVLAGVALSWALSWLLIKFAISSTQNRRLARSARTIAQLLFFGSNLCFVIWFFLAANGVC